METKLTVEDKARRYDEGEKQQQPKVEPPKVKETNTLKIVGYLLLSPALVSVLLFFIALLTKTNTLYNFDTFDSWTGDYNTGGYTSALPFYFGLMAIAGAYLIKDTKK